MTKSATRSFADELGIDDNATSTAVTIDASENVLVGKTSSTSSTVGVESSASGRIMATRSGGISALFNRTTSDGDIVDFRKDNTSVGSIGASGGDLVIGTGDTGIHFHDGVDSIMPWNVSAASYRDNAIDLGTSTYRYKDAYLSGGVYLGGTGAANKLQDYETGTWSPTLPNGGNVVNNNSYYTKIGRQVTVYFYIGITGGIPSNSSSFEVGGLPFAASSGVNYYHGGSIGYVGAFNSASLGMMLLVRTGSTRVYFQRQDGNATEVLNSNLSGMNSFIATAHYITS